MGAVVRSSFNMKVQSLALVFLAFALAAASADTTLDTGDADIDNVVDGELAKQELDREDNEPIQEDEDDNDLDIENLNDRELESNLEEEGDLDRLAGEDSMVSDRWSMGKIREKIRRAVRKALRRERRKLMRGVWKIMRRRSKEVRSCVNATRDIQRLLG